MNTVLTKAESWLNDLGIRTQMEGLRLAVNRADIANVCSEDEILGELQEALGTNRLFWTSATDETLNLETL